MKQKSHLLFAALTGSVALTAGASAADPAVGFNRDIRPILAENCFYCHGPDPAARKASLRLDREEGFFGERDGGPIVTKGKPEDSPLYERLTSTDKDEVMPPPKSHHVLKPQQIALLKNWIAEGAPWQAHWSLIKPARPVLPEVKTANWVRNPIDSFTLAKLEANGLTPAAEADRRTLARRLSLDLIGLPPAPEVVDHFVADTSLDAYEKLVDALMASPRYGEHRARYWLDVARYADTHGLHIDNYYEIWPYRDWVINAFNQNMHFDEFTIEQLAGDLLPNPTQSQLIATGFHRCNITTAEGGTIPEENLANYARDRVETTSWVWLGLTANCAVCHDHKFDPITTKDFYSMSAFFRNTTQEHTDKNIRDTAPVMVLPEGKDLERWKSIPGEITAANAAIAERRKQIVPDFEKWFQATTPAEVSTRIGATLVSLPLNEGSGKEVHGSIAGAEQTLSREQDYQWKPGKAGQGLVVDKGSTLDLGDVADFERTQAFSVSAWVHVTGNGSLISRMDVAKGYRGWDINIKDKEILVYLVNKWPENSILVTTQGAPLRPNDWRHITVTYDGAGKAGGVRISVNGVESKMRVANNTLTDTIRAVTPLRVGQRSTGEFFSGEVQDLQIFTRKLAPIEIQGLMRMPEALLGAAKAVAQRSPRDKTQLSEVYFAGDASAVANSHKLVQLDNEQKGIQARSVVTGIQQERMDTQPMAHILYRGQYDQPRDEVGAAVFSALHPLPKGAPHNRLGLAEWLMDANNPLTARVTINRMWQEVFGAGLVKSAEDFGIMSEPPSHPALLDWLAVEFRESGWDMKHMMRLIVTSATYRQSAALTRDKLERDPQNRLLSRGPRFRMDAEMVRDYALAATGELSPKIGGASVKPYQPEGVWEAVAMPGSNTREYKPDTGESLYRRSIYTFWKRSAPPPAMEAFNAPTRETSCLRRERTDTPIQALVTLNGEQFVEAARVLATHALKAAINEGDSPFDYIARHLLGRSLRPQEIAIVKKSQHDLLERYTAHPDEAKALLAVGDTKLDASLPEPQLAAWTMTCNQLMNLDEVLNK
ncbi:cytochrome c [Chthoniobacter flavus]|uniref:DUF1553 domain-containing protein n=1 Tax=Chthoniobacter flavus TaxID=191863 RepID=UPI00104BD3C1|nr:DUF1553 domain-containing protein [Chthoniobacter flavus]TCO92761.1 cytochrome c [Chthoniobacter flavus]